MASRKHAEYSYTRHPEEATDWNALCFCKPMTVILHEQYEWQQCDGPAQVVKVIVPILDNHARKHQQDHHLDKHYRQIKKWIFTILISEYSLKHPRINKHEGRDNKCNENLTAYNTIMQMMNQLSRLRNSIYEH